MSHLNNITMVSVDGQDVSIDLWWNMLKITKGLKKKKKGKKNKNKEDDLFDSAELEQYRREQQQKQETGTAETSEAGDSEKGEEWEKFKALTSGVDDILKKTQGDLDRIKSTSYFQKKPPGSSGTAKENTEVVKPEVQPTKGKWVGFEDTLNQEHDEGEVDDNKVEDTQLASKQEEEVVEEVEEEESELDEEQDDIFDTSYVDVVASGEVKLAYVPDSPIKEDDSFDPFDTSIVDKVIKTDPKKRNLVSLGCAVEVLTGKLEKATGAPDSVKTQRRRPKPQDLLLDSFDEDDIQFKVDVEPEPAPKSILDDDPVFAEETSAILDFPSVTPSLENKSLSTPLEEKLKSKEADIKDLVEEFIPINLNDKVHEKVELEPYDELDDEFAALAAESLAKTHQNVTNKPPKPSRPELPKVVAPSVNEEEEFDEFITGDDPFDTSFAAQILPGKFELKLIEKEILVDNENEVKINPTIQLHKFSENSIVDIQIKNTVSDFDFSANELTEQESLSFKHRDLLGGSTTDLSKISQSPIVPKSVEANSKDLTNDDPFDTSVINDLVAPGKTELKFLEKELLAEEKPTIEVELDNDFNPRAEEKLNNKPISRPDNLIVNSKRVSVPKIVAFDLKSPSNLPDLLAVGLEEGAKVSKPLTPYYPPNNVPLDKNEFDNDADPFDTSFVTNYPGKLELKLIEQELTSAKLELKRSLSDPDFDPRAETEDNQDKQLPTTSTDYRSPEQPDIISEEVKIEAKLHTPVTPRKITEVFEESEDFDPFDTSIANVLAPGKAEIKILETELIYAKENPLIQPINNIITETLTKKLTETKPVADFLEQPAEEITVKPLTPIAASSLDQEDIDPFDTSCVGAILPEVGSSQVGGTPASFNPFLAGNEFQDSSANDNPFMSSYDAQQTGNAFDSGTTNPFAFGAENSGADTDFFSMQSKPDETNAGINYENIFSSAPAQISTTKAMDIFSGTNMAEEVQSVQSQQSLLHEDLLTSADTTTDIFSTAMDAENASETINKAGPPRRPPPPRPGPPKETKDLILSVTGAMEATSSHLLDRLQATRTPSPTPMRDLHSPSPTQFGDLLEVDEPVAPPPSAVPQEVNFLGDDFDFQAPIVQPITTEKRPSLSEKSISPVTPVKSTGGISPPLGQVESSAITPPVRPAPPIVPNRPKVPPQPARSSVPVVPPVTPDNDRIAQETEQLQPLESKDTSFADVFGDEIPAAPAATQSLQSATDNFGGSFLENAVIKQQDDIFSTENENANVVSSDNDKFTVSTPFGDSKTNTDLISESTTYAEAENFSVQPFTDTSATFSDFSSSNALHDTEVNAPFLAQPEAPISDDFPQEVDIPNLDPAQQSYNIFDSLSQAQNAPKATVAGQDEFDAFAAKFESVGFGEISSTTKTVSSSDPFDPFSTAFSGITAEDTSTGFGADDNFDTFLSLREPPPVPQGTPARVSRGESVESNDDNDFNIFIKPKEPSEKAEMLDNGPMPALAPPPKSPSQMNAFQDTSPRFNPFDNTQEIPSATTESIFAQAAPPLGDERQIARTDSQETPPTPLFDEDVSQPLEDFPRIHYDGPGWEMQLRQPNKKKITGQRFWKKIFVKLVFQGENPVLQLFNGKDDKDPFQELPLQPCYSVSEIGAQQYDQYGKIFTVKLQFIYYKERPGVRPGQVTKAERITNKLSQFAAYAIQGDYQGVKEFGSDLKKLGLPVEHAPQISQLFKIGSQSYEDMKQFSMCIEEALFRLPAHRDRALNYKMEEVQITAVDELYVEQNANGGVEKQIARVRLFFLGFLSGMPDVELGVNDLVRQGKEVVGRHDIIPVVTEEWIRLENVEFHSCVQQDEYEKTRTIKFKPPDACYIELMRFRIRPPKNRELPLQLKTTICVTGNKVEIHGDILVPGFTSRKLGQIPCEDVMVRIPIPECWIYQFRVEKHFRYGSVKSAHRRTGKVKGIERFLGAIENMEPSLMEVSSGQAKYEHQHRAIVWRMPRLPKEGQGAYTTHNLVVRLQLTSYDQIPEELAKYCYLEFTMPATTVSHTTVRSVSIANSDSDAPPEKYVRQLARHEYRVEIEHSQGEGPSDYIAATVAKHPPPQPTVPEEPTKPATSDSDSDSA